MVLRTDTDKVADTIFDIIKHGDHQHQQWLRDKSIEVAEAVLEQIRYLWDLHE